MLVDKVNLDVLYCRAPTVETKDLICQTYHLLRGKIDNLLSRWARSRGNEFRPKLFVETSLQCCNFCSCVLIRLWLVVFERIGCDGVVGLVLISDAGSHVSL